MHPPILVPSLLARRKSYSGTSNVTTADDVCDDVDKKLRHFQEKYELQKARINKRTKIVKKYELSEDLYLTDHTVAEDDPRIVRSFKAMTRVRRRSGFDATLVRDKVWAAKMTKDLSNGFLKMDRIEIDRNRLESCSSRLIDAERATLNKRLTRAKTTLQIPQRTRSTSDSGISSIESANQELEKSLVRMSRYVSDLEARGGFVLPLTGEEIKTQPDPAYCEVSIADIEKNRLNEEEDLGLNMFPKIEGGDSARRRFPRRWSVIAYSPNNSGFNLKLPPISATYEDRDATSIRTLKRAFFSAPTDLNKLK
nr:uncharacterized protein LOC100180217 [Ciona intestinalis]|eukprot:XP_002123076.1 uncharacterized protein LOC100180217 [Ciona intestinalis]